MFINFVELNTNKLKNFLIIILLCVIIILINENSELKDRKNQVNSFNLIHNKTKRKNIGIVGYYIDNNIGNQLIKYSMDVVLKKYGFNPILISLKEVSNVNMNFLKKYVNIKEIKSYITDLNESDYDFLVVNSDQVWAYNFKRLIQVGFLSFAKKWNITKFVYAASLGFDHWTSSEEIIKSAKILVKQFSGISVREQNSIGIIDKNLGVKPVLVLDPTMLLNKADYLNIINNFKIDIDTNRDYLCSYLLDYSKIKQDYIKNISKELNYTIITIKINVENFIEEFIYHYNICKSIITDSFHGTVFSIIFNKPFIAFINNFRGNERFFSLNQTFHLNNRFIYPKQFNKNETVLLKNELNINMTDFNILKDKSIKYLEYNLGLNKSMNL